MGHFPWFFVNVDQAGYLQGPRAIAHWDDRSPLPGRRGDLLRRADGPV